MPPQVITMLPSAGLPDPKTASKLMAPVILSLWERKPLMVAKSHGQSRTPIYRVWHSMIERCRNPNSQSWSEYGGRGITVCTRWQQFENFIADMGDRPTSASLDRIDVNGPYSPGNCRWASPAEQANNRRNNRIVSYLGEDLTMSEWAKRTGLSKRCIEHRLNAGWRIEDALTRKPDRSANNRQSGLLLPKLE